MKLSSGKRALALVVVLLFFGSVVVYKFIAQRPDIQNDKNQLALPSETKSLVPTAEYYPEELPTIISTPTKIPISPSGQTSSTITPVTGNNVNVLLKVNVGSDNKVNMAIVDINFDAGLEVTNCSIGSGFSAFGKEACAYDNSLRTIQVRLQPRGLDGPAGEVVLVKLSLKGAGGVEKLKFSTTPKIVIRTPSGASVNFTGSPTLEIQK